MLTASRAVAHGDAVITHYFSPAGGVSCVEILLFPSVENGVGDCMPANGGQHHLRHGRLAKRGEWWQRHSRPERGENWNQVPSQAILRYAPQILDPRIISSQDQNHKIVAIGAHALRKQACCSPSCRRASYSWEFAGCMLFGCVYGWVFSTFFPLAAVWLPQVLVWLGFCCCCFFYFQQNSVPKISGKKQFFGQILQYLAGLQDVPADLPAGGASTP